MEKLSRNHLINAQNYTKKIQLGSSKRGQHPIEAVRDDLLMHKYDSKGNLKIAQFDVLKTLTSDFYDYMEYLTKKEPRSTNGKGSSITLYRGVSAVPVGDLPITVPYYIPSSWTHNISIAGNWALGEVLDDKGLQPTWCCLLELEYPRDALKAISAMPTGSEMMAKERKELGIKLDNQPEYEVILPSMSIVLTGYKDIEVDLGDDEVVVLRSYQGHPLHIQSKIEAIEELEELHQAKNLTKK